MDPETDPAAAPTTLDRLRARVLARWTQFPAADLPELDALLQEALERASRAERERLIVAGVSTHPMPLRLAVLVSDADLDTMYRLEWAELAISDDGRCYLIYRRRGGNDYASEWTPATTLPESMAGALPDVLALALLGGDSQ